MGTGGRSGAAAAAAARRPARRLLEELMRYGTRARLLAHKRKGQVTIQVRVEVEILLKLVDLQERLPYHERGYDLGAAIEKLVDSADRRSRQSDLKVDKRGSTKVD